MTYISRRGVILGGAAFGAVSACTNGLDGGGGASIDARVDQSLSYLESTYPQTIDLRNNAAGVLVIPLITEAGLTFGGAYGEGAMRVNGETVNYYSAANASFGLQFGVQQYSQALYFQNQAVLDQFQKSEGFEVGVDAKVAVLDMGSTALSSSLTEDNPVVALVYGQAGLIAGATIEGTKYTKIVR